MVPHADSHSRRVYGQLLWILAGFAAVLAIVGSAALIGVKTLGDNFHRLEQIVGESNAKSIRMSTMEESIRERMLLVSEVIYLQDDAFLADEVAQRFSARAGDFIAAREQLQALGLTPEQDAGIERQRQTLRRAQTILDEVQALAAEGEVAAAAERWRDARRANGEVLEELRAMRGAQQALAERALAEAAEAQQASRAKMLVLAGTALLLSLGIIGLVVRQILRQDWALRAALAALGDANRHLEHRVEERTGELMAAREENLRLGAEVDVSRRIQAMVLPRADELSRVRDLEVAGYMEPADEVGGDYYDVLQFDDHVVLGIGDVTGHGLESGVIMLMVQAAVRTLAETGALDLRDSLSVVNQVVYKNALRMESDKNLSLALLHYSRGRLQIAGQHEELLILREGRVLRVDTMELGFPLGLEADIRPFVQLYETELQPGETAVLYTDGITEAEDESRRLYGLERLCEVLARVADRPVGEILTEAICDVREHVGAGRLLDDISLLVVRRRAPELPEPRSNPEPAAA